jgi:fructose-bisphosphate aldolase class II
VEYAHDHGVVVEAELGTLAGIEDEVKVKSEDSSYTRPEDVQEFVTRTGCDSLAIAIGTSHGAYKFKPGTKPQLRFDILEEVEKRLPGFPIVLHGSSSVPQELVAKVNKLRRQYARRHRRAGGSAPRSGFHGRMQDQHRLRPPSGHDCHHPRILAEHPEKFDPREYLKPARTAVKNMVHHKIVDVLGSDNKI